MVKLFFALILSVLMHCQAISPAEAASDASAADTAKMLGSLWRNEAHKHLLVTHCAENTYAMLTVIFHHVDYDVTKSASVIFPYTIIVSLSMLALTNSSSNSADGFISEHYDGIHVECFKSLASAKSKIGPRDFSEYNGPGYGSVDGRLIYRYSDRGYFLVSIEPERLRNMLGRSLLSVENDPFWRSLIGTEK